MAIKSVLFVFMLSASEAGFALSFPTTELPEPGILSLLALGVSALTLVNRKK